MSATTPRSVRGRCHYFRLGQFHLGVFAHFNIGGNSYGCQLFSEPTLAVADEDLYLHAADGARGETLISSPLRSALRTVREVERLADAENCPTTNRRWPCWTAPWPSGTCSGATIPATSPTCSSQNASSPPCPALRDASTNRRPVAVAAYTSRPRTTEVAGAVRLMLCEQGDADCHRLCSARRSELAPCDRAAGFDDRELFELVLEPGHRSPLYRSSHLAARFALGLATGQEWSHFYYLNGGAEIARVEAPDWLASDPELLALSHTMLVKQCQLGLGYPVAISEAHEQAVISGHDREEFRRMALLAPGTARPALR